MKLFFQDSLPEAGCDEAGRGCLAGPVFAAAVILPSGFQNPHLRDSKKIKPALRYELRDYIENNALAWAVALADQHEIDELNILRASILAMHRALDKLSLHPAFIIVDGNRFFPYQKIPHHCIVKGDDKYLSIAAASILAKTYRDDYMIQLDKEFPSFGWKENKGYPTLKHREAIEKYGHCSHHRLSFLRGNQLSLPLP